MSEVQSRPATRGRSSTRGRGGFRGPPRSKQLNGDQSSVDHTADEGELGELKQQYRGQLTTLKEMFPDWTDMDLLLGLQDCDGDLQSTIEKITEGNVSQFAEIKKKTKDRSRSKIKDGTTTSDATGAPRSGRGRGNQDAPRAGRGRGGERGRGGFRGGRGAAHGAPSGARAEGDKSVPTTESAAWDNSGTSEGFETTGAWEQSSVETAKALTSEQQAAPAAAVATPQAQQKPASPEAPAKKTWASMFAKPKSAPAPPKQVPQPSVGAFPDVEEPLIPDEAAENAVEQEDLPIPPASDEALAPEIPSVEVQTPDIVAEDPALDLTPSKDELTEENVEHIPDVSLPIQTETVASTVDPGSVVGSATPANQSTPTAAPRPPMGGFATSAFKATATPGRSASYQRRLFDQQEAVVMPGNHAVDRATVQFGSLGLNGEADPDALDVDEEREEAETREQPPQHSPTAQPRTALPPAPRQPSIPIEQQPTHEAVTAPKQAPGLPPPIQQQQSPSNPLAPQAISQQGSQGNQQYSQFGRYGQSAESTAPAQKSYDPFSNQAPQPSQFDNYQSQSQAPGQQSQTAQSGLGGFSSAPSDYASYYGTSDQQRSGYQSYYNNAYGQQSQQPSSNQDAGANQQRSGSAFGSTSGESAFPTSQSQQASTRYGEAQNSGNNTPNPGLGAQQNAQSQQGPNVHQQHAHSGHGAGYNYNHPYYATGYYQNYMTQLNQYGGGFGNQGYGPYGGKGGQMHGQPHYGYGMSPQSSYDQHSSSPANAGGFGQSSGHGRESNLGGGFGDYGRGASAQQSSGQQHGAGSTGFGGGASESFGRPPSGFPGQGQQYGQQQSSQQSGAEDSLKPFSDSKANAGPSPSLGQPGRPGSATNNSGSAGNSGLPPPQQGFSGYPSHLGGQQSSQYGGLGGLGGHQQGGHQGGGQQGHQAGGYGYGAGGFGGYNSGYNRGGWSSNYQGH